MKCKKITSVLLAFVVAMAAVFICQDKTNAESALPGRPAGDYNAHYLLYESDSSVELMTFDSFVTDTMHVIKDKDTGAISNVRSVKRYTLTDGEWVLKDKGMLTYDDMADVTFLYSDVNVCSSDGTELFQKRELPQMKRRLSIELDGTGLIFYVGREEYVIDRTHTSVGLTESAALSYGDSKITQSNDGPRLTNPTFLETDSYGVKTAASYWYSPDEGKVYVTAGNNITNYDHTVFSHFVNINQGFNNGKWSILQNQSFSEYATGVAKSSYFFITVIDLSTMTYSKGATESQYGKNNVNYLWNQNYTVPDNLVYIYSTYDIAGYEVPYIETVNTEVEISYVQPDTYTVTVPAAINISDTVSEYDISSIGNISNSKELKVTVNESYVELTSDNSDTVVRVEFRNSADTEATDNLASFTNKNQDGYVDGEIVGNNTYNKSITRYMVVTTEDIPAGTYTGTCTFHAELKTT